MKVEEMGRYDPYTDSFLKNTTANRIEVGTDGNLYRLSVSNGNEYLPKDKLYTKVDVMNMLDKIRAGIESYKLSEDELSDMDEDSVKWGMKIAYDIVDNAESEIEDGNNN